MRKLRADLSVAFGPRQGVDLAPIGNVRRNPNILRAMQRPRRTRLRWLATAGLVCAIGMTGGCRKYLFPKSEPRTQFEAHQLMRDQYVPADQPDVFGNPQPALRARLTRVQ